MREWLMKVREEENKKPHIVALSSGITRQYFNMIENGERRPSPEVAKRIAAALHFDKYGFDWTKFYEDEKEVG